MVYSVHVVLVPAAGQRSTSLWTYNSMILYVLCVHTYVRMYVCTYIHVCTYNVRTYYSWQYFSILCYTMIILFFP